VIFCHTYRQKAAAYFGRDDHLAFGTGGTEIDIAHNNFTSYHNVWLWSLVERLSAARVKLDT
jgi:hypothetical protein